MHGFTGRTRIRLGVEVWHQKRRLGGFRTRDIDMRAVFIEMPSPLVPHYACVTAHFLIDRDGVHRYPVQGRVIRCAADGVAVLFQSEITTLLRALEQQDILPQPVFA